MNSSKFYMYYLTIIFLKNNFTKKIHTKLEGKIIIFKLLTKSIIEYNCHNGL